MQRGGAEGLEEMIRVPLQSSQLASSFYLNTSRCVSGVCDDPELVCHTTMRHELLFNFSRGAWERGGVGI